MNPKIFRKVSLERLSSPDQLDELETVTSKKNWLTLLGFVFLLIGCMAFVFFAQLPSKVSGNGLLLHEGGIQQVQSMVEGQVTELYVQQGSFVQKGDVIARVFHPNWEGALQQGEVNHNQIVSEMKVISSFSGRVVALHTQKGEYVTQGNAIVSLELGSEETSVLEAVIYVPVYDGKKIKPGMKSAILLNEFPKEQYGFIEGTVTYVSSYPVAMEQINMRVNNTELAKELSRGEASFEVRIQLTTNAKTPSGLQWSTGDGPTVRIDSGTLCQGEVILSEKPPAQLIFPAKEKNE